MNNLGQQTGGSEDARVTEAHQLCHIICESAGELTPREREFVMQMTDCTTCSGRQLFWLRDIKDKYL